MVKVAKIYVANLGDILVTNYHFGQQLFGCQKSVVTAYARHNYRHLPVKTGFTCSVRGTSPDF